MTSGSPQDRGGSGGRVSLVVVAAASLAIAVWAVAALVMAGRGFDVTDEGFYVLSYRWWDSTPRVFTGVQYLYGPVFQLLGWSVPGLRVVRLLSVLLTHLAFGWAFMGWLRTRRPEASPGRRWELAGALVIAASGGVTYGWLPLSPGYNDVVLLTSLLLTALLLWSMRVVAGGHRLPVLAAACAGPPVAALLLAKWVSAGVILFFLLVLGIVALRAMRATGWLRYAGTAVASVAVCLVAVNAFVVPLRPMVSQLVEVNRIVAADTNSPVALLGLYLRTTVSMTVVASVLTVVALLLAGAGLLAARGRFAAAAPWLAALGPVVALLVVDPARLGLPAGGPQNIRPYVVVLIGLALTVLVARAVARAVARTVAGGRRTAPTTARGGDGAVVVLLLLLPAVQALGTGNALAFVAVNQVACWVALMVAACTAIAGDQVAHALAVSATACAVVVAAAVGTDGLLVHPYRATPAADATTRVGGHGPLARMKVDPATAARFAALRDAAGARRTGDPTMGFDEMAGLVLLLDGHTVGEAWYSRLDPGRTAAGIRSVCTKPHPWGEVDPVVIYDRAPGAADEAALRACGLSLTRDYTLVDVHTGTPALHVYVPVDPAERTRR